MESKSKQNRKEGERKEEMTRKEERGARREWLAIVALVFELVGPLFPQAQVAGLQLPITFFYVQDQRIFLKEAMENEILSLVLLKQKSRNLYRESIG